jgi:hypothetical protein
VLASLPCWICKGLIKTADTHYDIVALYFAAEHPTVDVGHAAQVIALVAYLVQERRKAGPFMVVAPSSLIANWEQEFHHWAPSLKLVSYKGSADARAALFTQQVLTTPSLSP